VKHLLTLLIGFVVGVASLWGMFVFSTHRTPAPPELRSPTAIKVTFYPTFDLCAGVGNIDGGPLNIPSEEMDLAFRLLTPGEYYGGVNDFIARIVAEVAITHADGEQTRVFVRYGGKNPAVVSVDGRNYFYARNDPDVHDGVVQLIQLANRAARKK
jgi:hypothetical protein